MNSDLRKLVAQSLDAPPELLPWIPQLLEDFSDLAGPAEDLLELMRGLSISAESRVLDLGCGKGSISMKVADAYQCRVFGVDAMPEFVRSAAQEARRRGLDRFCRFVCADVREFWQEHRSFDFVIYWGVGQYLGSPAEYMSYLRKQLRPGGHVFLDDDFVDDDVSSSAADIPTRTQMRAALQSHGDLIVREQVSDSVDSIATEQRYYRCIEQRAQHLATTRPELSPLLDKFLENQRMAQSALHDGLRYAAWAIRKT